MNQDTPLRAALIAERPHIVQLLLEYKCNSKVLGPGGESILHLAVGNISSKGGSIALLRVLLDTGVDPNMKSSTTGRTALHLAAEKGNTDHITLLLESEVKVDALDDNLDTALLVAAHAGNGEAIKLLVSGGANINSKTSEGMTALNETSKRGRATEVIQVLLNAGADTEIGNPADLTSFLTAARWGNNATLELLSKVSDVKASDNNGNTAMHLVA